MDHPSPACSITIVSIRLLNFGNETDNLLAVTSSQTHHMASSFQTPVPASCDSRQKESSTTVPDLQVLAFLELNKWGCRCYFVLLNHLHPRNIFHSLPMRSNHRTFMFRSHFVAATMTKIWNIVREYRYPFTASLCQL